MPRDPLELDVDLQRLSILDEEGNVDDDLVPEVDDATLAHWLEVMIRGRRFEERRLRLQRQGRIGTFAPAIGQEAAQVGAVSALEDRDWVVPAFRESVAAIMRNVPLSKLLLYDAGFNEGGDVSPELRVLPIAIPVGSQLPYATGIAYAARADGSDEVVMVFFGEGATSEGDFHESVNFAAVQGCPVVFVCQNNQYAISTPVEEQTASSTFAQKAVAHGIPGIQVDGNDVLGVHVAAREAVARAREGGGPTLLECVTYRMSVHTTADDPSKYRDDEEVEEWRDRDPIERFRRYLSGRGVDDEEIERIEQETEERLDTAWRETEEQIGELGAPAAMFEHVYAEMPPYLDRQRRWALGENGDRRQRDESDADEPERDEDDGG
ncbi:MAG: pyruvate dehydrogenase (acetyl-transferring) E1 component subunit alpha [Acidimicrobiales bacterium]